MSIRNVKHIYKNIKLPDVYKESNLKKYIYSNINRLDKNIFIFRNKINRLCNSLESSSLINLYDRFKLNDEHPLLSKVISSGLRIYRRLGLEADMTDSIAMTSISEPAVSNQVNPNAQNNPNQVQNQVKKTKLKVNNGIKEQWNYVSKHISDLIQTYVDKLWLVYDKNLDIDLIKKIKEHDEGIYKDIRTEEREIEKEKERIEKEKEKEKEKAEKEESSGGDDLGMDDMDFDLDMPDFNSYKISLEEDDPFADLGDMGDLGNPDGDNKDEPNPEDMKPETTESEVWYIPKTVETSVAGLWVLDNKKNSVANHDTISTILENTKEVLTQLMNDGRELSNSSRNNLLSNNTSANDGDDSALGKEYKDIILVGGIKPTMKDSKRVHFNCTTLKQLTIDEILNVFEIYSEAIKVISDIKNVESRTRRNIEGFLNNYTKTGDEDILKILLNVIDRYSDVYSNIIYIGTTLRNQFYMLIISLHLKNALRRLKVHKRHPELDEEKDEEKKEKTEEQNEEGV